MRRHTAKSLATLLHGSRGPLARTLRQARQLQALDRAFAQLIDPALQPHCQVANLRDGCLVVQVDAPAWATRLRFEQQRILKQLRKKGITSQIAKLSIQVKPATGNRQEPSRSRKPLGQGARRQATHHLQQINDPELRRRLNRLLSTAAKPPR